MYTDCKDFSVMKTKCIIIILRKKPAFTETLDMESIEILT